MPPDVPSHDAPADGPLTVVGLGASAGGVEALGAFFDGLPEAEQPGPGRMAFVVVVHLADDEESRLAEVLQGRVSLPVSQVVGGEPVEAGHVYVIPPGQNLRIADGRLVLEPIEEERIRRRPVDHFFRALAEACGPRAVAVILSGTGANGTVGVRRVRECGGYVGVQDPDDAAFDEMPRSAIDSGVADVVAPAGALAAAASAYAGRLGRQLPEALPGDDAEALRAVLAELRAQTGHDFAHYKRSTVLRRLDRRLHVTGEDSLGAYLARLRQDDAEAQALLADLLISVTNFFRDSEVFEALAAHAPRMFQEKGPRDEVRAWVAACATGEEAYSVAMVLLDHAATLAEPPRVQVFATDLSEADVRTARAGHYPESIEADVSEERLRRFFVRENGRYRVSAALREAVVFAPHSLLKDPPFSRLDLVSCRNLLIYLQRDLQQQVLARLHYALHPGGLLLLGTSENASLDLFAVVDKGVCLYRRRDVETPMSPAVHLPRTPRGPARVHAPVPPPALAVDEHERLHRSLREEAAPPSVLVDGADEVVHVSDHATPFLRVAGGAPSRSLARLLVPDLRAGVLAALFQARRDGRPVDAAAVSSPVDGESRAVTARVRPVGDGLAQVLFRVSAPGAAPTPDAPDPQRDALEVSLLQTREQLRVTVEQFETGREDLRAQNEELQSINEELRSTAEELETSKEEAQSMAEELRTVNDELKHKVDETARAKGDLENLITSTEIATLFLDRGLRIQRFTPRVREHFHVLASDLGRPLGDLAQKVGGARLVEDAEAVLDRLETTERELEGADGRWFLVHSRPYRTAEDRIDGVVITFVDITARKASEEALRVSEERHRLLVESATEYAILMLDPDGTITAWNKGAEQVLGYAEAEAVGRSGGIVFAPSEEADADLAHEIAEATRDGRYPCDRWLARKDGVLFWASGILTALYGPAGELRGFTKILRDDTSRKTTEIATRRLNAALEARVAERTAQVRALSTHLVAAEQNERERIARVLHDDLQQQLYGLGMTLGALHAGPADDATRGLQDKAESILDAATTLTRSLAVELSPSILGGDRADALLDWLAERKRALYGLEIEAEAEPGLRIEATYVRVLLYQALRELLFNVVKHAGTNHATVRLGREGGDVVALVEDQGVGFVPEDHGAEEGFGLPHLRERIELVGGTLSVESAPGRGARVTARIPLPPPAQSDGGAAELDGA